MENSDRFFHTTIGQVVKAWRQKRGLTVTELAQRVEGPITKGYISQLEHDKIHQPSDEHLGRLASALGITVQALVTRQMPDEPQDRGGKDMALPTRVLEPERPLSDVPARGANVRRPLRTRSVVTAARTGVPEMTVEAMAHEIATDADLHAAYTDLKRALANPQWRETVINALRAFARAAQSRS